MKKVNINYTPQGYSYIKCNRQDCFNWGGVAICDSCGKDMKKEVFLIYILNSAYCPDCFKDWKDSAKKFKKDILMQKQYDLKWYKVYGFEPLEGGNYEFI